MVDASIPLQIRPVQVENPLDIYQRAQGIKSAQQQQQMGALQLEQAKQEFDDQQKLRQIYPQTGGDVDKLFQMAGQAGVAPQTLIKLKAAALEQRKKLADLDETVLKNHKAKADVIANRMEGVLNGAPEQRQALWDQARNALLSEGMIAPDHMPAQFDESVARTYANSKNLFDAEQKRRETAARELTAQTSASRLQAELPKITADAQASQLGVAARTAPTNQAEWDAWRAQQPLEVQSRIPAMFSPAARDRVIQMGLSPAEAINTAETAKRDAANAANQQANLRLRGREVAASELRANIEKARYGFESSGGVSDAAKMLAEGKMSPQTARSMLRTNPGLISQVRSIDPSFDEADIENRFNTLKEFTSTSNSKAGGQIIALNTLIHHADLYLEAARALKNGTFVPGNEVYNKVATAFGAAPPTNAALVARFFAGETGKVATGGVPAEGEINGILKNLSTSGSDTSMREAGETLLKLAAGRLTPLQERAKQGKIDKVIHVLGPDAKQILERHGFNPETMKEQPAVPLPLTLSPSDVGKVYTNRAGQRIKITAINPADPKQFKSEVQ